MPVMNFDLEDGLPPVSFSLKEQDAERFMDFMAECQAVKDRSPQPQAEQPAPTVCGVCNGRGERDVAHGETAPCPNCGGTGLIGRVVQPAPNVPEGWKISVQECDDETILRIDSPDGSRCSFCAAPNSHRANVLHHFATALAAAPAPASKDAQVAERCCSCRTEREHCSCHCHAPKMCDRGY